MERFLVDFGSQLGAPRGPANRAFGVKSAPGATLEPKWPPGPIQARFLVDLGRFWVDLGRFWVDFGSIRGRCWALGTHFSSILEPTWVPCWTNLGAMLTNLALPDNSSCSCCAALMTLSWSSWTTSFNGIVFLFFLCATSHLLCREPN